MGVNKVAVSVVVAVAVVVCAGVIAVAVLNQDIGLLPHSEFDGVYTFEDGAFVMLDSKGQPINVEIIPIEKGAEILTITVESDSFFVGTYRGQEVEGSFPYTKPVFFAIDTAFGTETGFMFTLSFDYETKGFVLMGTDRDDGTIRAEMHLSKI